MELNPFTVQIIISAVLPFLLGFVMKSRWPDKLKSNIGIVIAAVATLVTNAVNETGVAFLSWEMLQLFILGLAIQLATYNGFYKPSVRVNETLPSVVPDSVKPNTP